MTLCLNDEYLSKEFKSRVDSQLEQAQVLLSKIQKEECVGSDMLGWYDLPKKEGFELLQSIKKSKENYSLFFDICVVIGIGGSYLGTKAIHDLFTHRFLSENTNGQKPLVFLGQDLSESTILETLDLLEKKHPLVIVISKSGNTIEPSIAFRVMRNYLLGRYSKEEANERVIAITDEKSGTLRLLAEKENFKTFCVPENIGGRYSVLSSVGMVPLTFCGFNTESMMQGAHKFFSEMKEKNVNNHPVLRYAAIRKVAWDLGKRVESLNYNEPKFFSVVEWWKQLFGESEGKNGLGLLPMGAIFSTDLHSLGQYFQDGPKCFLETFFNISEPLQNKSGSIERRIRVPFVEGHLDKSEGIQGRLVHDINTAAMESALFAHKESSTPCISFELSILNEFWIGYLFAFFETSCAISALMHGLNPFDQPGVEHYKKHLMELTK